MTERGGLLRGGARLSRLLEPTPPTGRTLRGRPRLGLTLLPPDPEIAATAAAIVADAADLLPADPSLLDAVAAVAAEGADDASQTAAIAAAAKRAQSDAIARESKAIEAERLAIAAERAALERAKVDEIETARETGHAEGMLAAAEEIEALRARLRGAIEAVAARHAGPDETAALVAELSLVVARAVIGDAVRADLSLITARVRGAIAAIGLEDNLILRAEPGTAALLRAEIGNERRLSIDEDPRMTPGAIELEGGANRLDVGIDAAIEAVATALREEVGR